MSGYRYGFNVSGMIDNTNRSNYQNRSGESIRAVVNSDANQALLSEINRQSQNPNDVLTGAEMQDFLGKVGGLRQQFRFENGDKPGTYIAYYGDYPKGSVPIRMSMEAVEMAAQTNIVQWRATVDSHPELVAQRPAQMGTSVASDAPVAAPQTPAQPSPAAATSADDKPYGPYGGKTYGASDEPRSVVRAAQAQLEMLNFRTGQREGFRTPDGIPGPKTDEAIKAFQKEHKLPETGDLDQKTRDTLAAAAEARRAQGAKRIGDPITPDIKTQVALEAGERQPVEASVAANSAAAPAADAAVQAAATGAGNAGLGAPNGLGGTDAALAQVRATMQAAGVSGAQPVNADAAPKGNTVAANQAAPKSKDAGFVL